MPAISVPAPAWIAGAALAVMVVAAVLGNGLSVGYPGAGDSGAPAAIVPASAAPSAVPTEAGGKGGGGNGGNGHGNGNGNGNGNGHGGGNDD